MSFKISHRTILLVSLFLVALSLRILLLPNSGFVADIAFWKSWGLAALDHGIVWSMHNTNNNYPAPFAYGLGIIVFIYRLFANPHNFNQFWNENNVLFLAIAKLPAIIADLGIAGVILVFGKLFTNSQVDTKSRPLYGWNFAVLLAILYLFNPVSLLDGALWGQVDSVGVLLFLLAILAGTAKRPMLAGILYMTAFLTKLQNMIYGPLFFLFLWQWMGFAGLVRALAGAALAFVGLNIQFFLSRDMGRVIQSLSENYDYFPWMSLNAFNPWWVFAKAQGMKVSDKLLAVGILNAKTTGLILFSTGYLLAGITMVKETLKRMIQRRNTVNENNYYFEDNIGGARRGTPVERPQSRNLVVRTLYNLRKLFVWPMDTHNTIEQCGARTSDGGKPASPAGRRAMTLNNFFYEQQRFDVLFYFFTALIIAASSFFLFQTESHDRYAFPISVFFLFWGAFFVFRSSTEKERKTWWKARSFRTFLIGYILYSFFYFINLHTALTFFYPENGIPALLPLRVPSITIAVSILQTALFFLFLWVNKKTIGLSTFLLCILFTGLCFLVPNLTLLFKRPLSLTRLTPYTATSGYGFLNRDMPANANPAGPATWSRLSVQYSFYEKGIGTHADSLLVYDIGKHFSRFTSDIGIDTEAGSQASVIFKITGDVRVLYQSDVVKRYESPRHVDVDIRGVRLLELDVQDAGNGNTDDHADWLRPTLWP